MLIHIFRLASSPMYFIIGLLSRLFLVSLVLSFACSSLKARWTAPAVGDLRLYALQHSGRRRASHSSARPLLCSAAPALSKPGARCSLAIIRPGRSLALGDSGARCVLRRVQHQRTRRTLRARLRSTTHALGTLRPSQWHSAIQWLWRLPIPSYQSLWAQSPQR
jgi:hypothetical protein